MLGLTLAAINITAADKQALMYIGTQIILHPQIYSVCLCDNISHRCI